MFLLQFQNFIDLICDVKSMEDAVKEMKYDAKKAPLGTSDSSYKVNRWKKNFCI